MTGKILTVANSSAYHRGGRQVSLEQSMVALGTDMIKTLVISDSVFQTFSSFPNSGATDLRRFWKQSLTAAVLARELARRLDYSQPEEAYLAGLLHNVGRLALLAAAPKEYTYNFSARDDEDLCAVEQRTLQITHAEAGAWLVERWQLDSFLADAVLYHHEPSKRLEDAHPLIRIVRLAHVLACHPDDSGMIEQSRMLCGLDEDEPRPLLAQAARQVEKTAIQLGIDLAGADDLPGAGPGHGRRSGAAAPVRGSAQPGAGVRGRPDPGAPAGRKRPAGSDDALGAHPVRLRERRRAAGEPDRPGAGRRAGREPAAHRRIRDFAGPVRQAGRRSCFLGARTAPGLRAPRRASAGPARRTIIAPARHRGAGVRAAGGRGALPGRAGRRRRRLAAGGLPEARTLPASLRQPGRRRAGNAMSERGHARRQLASVAEEYREASRRIVHEVNNPLSIIKNYLSVLDSKLERQEPVGRAVDPERRDRPRRPAGRQPGRGAAARRRHAGGRRRQGGRGSAAPVPHDRTLSRPTSRWWSTWEKARASTATRTSCARSW
jgi:hypothetical protein